MACGLYLQFMGGNLEEFVKSLEKHGFAPALRTHILPEGGFIRRKHIGFRDSGGSEDLLVNIPAIEEPDNLSILRHGQFLQMLLHLLDFIVHGDQKKFHPGFALKTVYKLQKLRELSFTRGAPGAPEMDNQELEGWIVVKIIQKKRFPFEGLEDRTGHLGKDCLILRRGRQLRFETLLLPEGVDRSGPAEAGLLWIIQRKR
jgi:hypothetical protein